MYANTSRRPPPSGPFFNLLYSLVYLPLRLPRASACWTPPLLSAHFLTPAGNTVSREPLTCPAHHSPVTSVASLADPVIPAIQGHPDRTSYGASKGSVAPGRKARSGRALTAGGALAAPGQRQMQPYGRAHRVAARFDEIAPLSGPPPLTPARSGTAGRQAPDQGARSPAPVSLTSHTVVCGHCIRP
jgi:hypothetical protein